ncbi:serine/threonine-protein kinase dbf2 [Naganishia albida]|nr:serine/threonine-protein kinase dbf2 [Naganishia albida]
MFSRIMNKATGNGNTSPTTEAPATPSKSSAAQARSGVSSGTTSLTPSKIPVAASSRSGAQTQYAPAVPAKENRRSQHASEDSYIPSSSRVSRQTASETSTRSGIPQPAFQTHGIRTPAPSAVDPQNAYKSHIVPGGADDIHMMTINPSSISPTLLEQLALHDEAVAESASTSQNVPVPSIADQRVQVDHHRNVQEDTRDRDIRMQTANRGYVPPASHAQAQRQQAYQSHQVPVQTQPLQQPQQQQPTAPPALTAWEKQILNDPDVKRKATLAQLYFLDYYFDFLGYLNARKGRLQTFKADTAARNLTSEEYTKEFRSYAGRERVVLRKRRTKLKVDQFRIIAQVGQGGYGSVYLARRVDTGQVCALKKMKKATLAKMDEVKHVLVERDILTATKTPWLVRLLYAFQDREHVYLAMEYVPGGDFRTLLNNSGVLKEEHARFYSAEMFMGVNELHKLGYIHRDLKPENFLVDASGHVKLTDFGLATGALNPQKIESMKHKLDQVKDENLVIRSTLERRTIYKSIRMAEPRYADSVVGSPDYMPPEVLRGKTYTYSADYWSLGCILFEFLCGFPPFSGSTPEETWANLKNWQRVLRRPVYDKPEDLIFNLTDQAWDAVIRLIAHPRDRVSNIQDVQSMPFYQALQFNELRQTASPFVPMLDSELDVGYFDSFSSPEDMAKYAEVFKKQQDVDAVAERGIGERSAWVGFTFGRNVNLPPPPQQRKREGDTLSTMF